MIQDTCRSNHRPSKRFPLLSAVNSSNNKRHLYKWTNSVCSSLWLWREKRLHEYFSSLSSLYSSNQNTDCHVFVLNLNCVYIYTEEQSFCTVIWSSKQIWYSQDAEKVKLQQTEWWQEANDFHAKYKGKWIVNHLSLLTYAIMQFPTLIPSVFFSRSFHPGLRGPGRFKNSREIKAQFCWFS